MSNTITRPRATLREERDARPLGRYTDHAGRHHEVAGIAGEGGVTLVIDQLTAGAGARLVGRIEPDEPDENAQLLARLYLQDPSRGRCKPLTGEDLQATVEDDVPSDVRWDLPLIDGAGKTFRLDAVNEERCGRSIRWTQTGADGRRVVSVRDVVAALEAYEPARTLIPAALRFHEGTDVSTCIVRAELRRIHSSPIVLNRGLREHIQRVVATGELTLSEIAIRCARVKRDRAGNESGDTSWLARRTGQLPEAGKTTPTPWVHSDVLALIARDGLGVSPREVEVE